MFFAKGTLNGRIEDGWDELVEVQFVVADIDEMIKTIRSQSL